MGVGDISEVSGDSWGSGDTAGGDNGRGAGRERDTGLVGGLGRTERDAQAEPGGDRVGVSDGARVEHGACDVHGAGSGGADGVRGDGVGVGDISEVSGDAWGSGDTAGGDDGRTRAREHNFNDVTHADHIKHINKVCRECIDKRVRPEFIFTSGPTAKKLRINEEHLGLPNDPRLLPGLSLSLSLSLSLTHTHTLSLTLSLSLSL